MDAPVGDATEVKTGNAWSQNPRTLVLIAAAAFALLGLVTLAAAIDLPRSETADDTAASTADQFDGSGFSGNGEIDLGDNTGVDIRPIPGCPDGFAIGEDIYVVPDPEACGFRPLEPGERGFDPNGKILLVPSQDGDVGGMRIGPDGSVQLLPPGVLGPNDFAIGQFPDGSFGLVRPDGSQVEIAPGDDGLSLRDPERGGSQFFPNNGSGGTFGQNGQNGQGFPPGIAQPDDSDAFQNDGSAGGNADDDNSPDNNSGIDWSFLGPVLLVLLALVLVAGLVIALRNNEWGSSDDDDEPDQGDVQDTIADYSAEIGALDRLLWEIDQESDPRTAIRRVYAALETGLDNPDMARRRSETPGIYLRRILGQFTELEAPLRDLTDLFEQARFSEHEITHEMRDQAVRTLVAVRAHYAHASRPGLPASPAVAV